jgi:hypothetical protein
MVPLVDGRRAIIELGLGPIEEALVAKGLRIS